MLSGSARKFNYLDLISIKDWHTMVNALRIIFNISVQMAKIWEEFLDLHINNFIRDGFSCGDSLQQLAHRIEDLVPQSPCFRTGNREKSSAFTMS